MKKPKMYLMRRPENGVWYFRRPIPKELQPFVTCGNTRTVTVSLKTKSLIEARKSHHEHWMESERVLEEARVRMNAGARAIGKDSKRPTARELVTKSAFGDFSKPELIALVQEWYLRAKGEALDRYRTAFSFGDAQERECDLAELDKQLASLERRSGAAVDYEPYRVMREIIEDAGGYVTIMKRGAAISLHVWFNSVVRERLILLNRYAQGILKTGVPPILEDASPEFASVQHVKAASSVPFITLDALIDRFDKDSVREHVKPKTRDEFKLVYAMLREAVGGAAPLAEITRTQIKELQELYRNLPAHSARLYPKKTLREAAELAKRDGKPPMERATFNKRMTLLSSVFNYAVREQMIPSSPAKGLTLPESTKEAGEKSFTIGQLKIIFAGDVYQKFATDEKSRLTPNHPLHPHEFWAPLVALYQGFRMDEILQLRADDIGEQDSITCFRIRAGEGQSLKNEVTRRRVPVHPELKRLGFLRYVEAIRESGFADLFPDAARGKTYGNRSHNYSKRFNRFLAEVGVKKGRDQVFHSFRHTFVDGLRNAGVPEDVRRRLGGWKEKISLEESYGGRLLPLLAEHLAKLKYDGLDLSHLSIREV